jgi:hypothetical protein
VDRPFRVPLGPDRRPSAQRELGHVILPDAGVDFLVAPSIMADVRKVS